MATNRKPNGNNHAARTQADKVMELIREGTAVQIELLGAAARVWSDIVERVADYNRELTNQLLEFSTGNTDANESLEHLVRTGKRHVEEFRELPGKIGKDFERNAKQRARMGQPTD